MRTINKHPKWMHQPLRLNRKERKKPVIVINDFFEHYHLNEVRQVLWNWTTELISSENNISYSAVERSNVLFFYEKIEALVEAVYIERKRKLVKQRSQSAG
jgi:hypothetical protein